MKKWDFIVLKVIGDMLNKYGSGTNIAKGMNQDLEKYLEMRMRDAEREVSKYGYLDRRRRKKRVNESITSKQLEIDFDI